MSYLSDDVSLSSRAERPLSKAPQHAIYVLSLAAGFVAALRNPLWSAVAYGFLLIGGCGLLFFDRVRIVVASRKGDIAARYVTRYDQGALAVLLLGCLLNGLVVAMELARG